MRAVCNNLSIARASLLTQQNCHLISDRRKRGRERKRDKKRRFYLANFINFAISWQWSSNGFRTPRAKRLFSCLCASIGFVREIAEHVYNVAISRMLPRHPGEHSGLDLYDTKLETRHSDDTFHTRHVKILFLFRTLPLKMLGISHITARAPVEKEIPSKKKFLTSCIIIGDSIFKEYLWLAIFNRNQSIINHYLELYNNIYIPLKTILK